MARTPLSHEAEAFFDALQGTPPSAVTACAGWTTREIVAHMAASAGEITRHLVPYLEGDPVPSTRSFEEREAPYRALPDAELRNRLERDEQAMRAAIDDVLAVEPDATIPWSGRMMGVAKFIPHMRNEFAIHRWDFTGDDDISDRDLAQPELTEHAVDVLGRILVAKGAAGDPQPGTPFAVRLRADGAGDIRVVVAGEHAGL